MEFPRPGNEGDYKLIITLLKIPKLAPRALLNAHTCPKTLRDLRILGRDWILIEL
jgi:hypothetical protein